MVGAILLLNLFVSHVAWSITSLLQVSFNKLSYLLLAGSDATTFLPKAIFIGLGSQFWGVKLLRGVSVWLQFSLSTLLLAMLCSAILSHSNCNSFHWIPVRSIFPHLLPWHLKLFHFLNPFHPLHPVLLFHCLFNHFYLFW